MSIMDVNPDSIYTDELGVTIGHSVDPYNDCHEWRILYCSRPDMVGKHHKTDGPAVVYSEVSIWHLYGLRHRVDGPAFIHSDGSEEWYYEGVCHRFGAPAVIDTDPNYGPVEEWYEHGERHRINGPALTKGLPGDQVMRWYQHDRLHRTDGPAVINDKGGGTNEYFWFIHGTQITTPELFRELTGMPEEEMTMLMLRYGGF